MTPFVHTPFGRRLHQFYDDVFGYIGVAWTLRERTTYRANAKEIGRPPAWWRRMALLTFPLYYPLLAAVTFVLAVSFMGFEALCTASRWIYLKFSEVWN